MAALQFLSKYRETGLLLFRASLGLVAKLLQRIRDRFDAALHVGFDDQVQLFDRARTDARKDRLERHLGKCGHFFRPGSQERRPGRRRALAGAARAHRSAAQHLQRGRRRHRNVAVRALDHAASRGRRQGW